VFKEFLKAQYCQENLDFYLACEKYRKLDPSGVGRELVKFMATQIYNDHLSENARHPVNVNNACVQIIKDHLKDPEPDLLCDAQAEIFELMRTDCYPRFCRTWKLDRDFAQKILYQTPQTKSNQSSYTISFTSESTNASHTMDPPLLPPRRSSLRLSSRSRDVSQSSDSTSGCPHECPYFRVGRLPCHNHKKSEASRHKLGSRPKTTSTSTLDTHVDLKKIHCPPRASTLDTGLPPPLLTSPPPPLPPKPENIDFSQIGADRYRPYVGRVFHV
jgi:hypothetical protein